MFSAKAGMKGTTLLGLLALSGCDGIHLGEDPCGSGPLRRTELAEGTIIEMRLGAPISEARCLLPVDEGMTFEWKHYGLWDSYGKCRDRSKWPEDWRLERIGEHWPHADVVEIEQGRVGYYYASFAFEPTLILDSGCEVSAKFYMNASEPDIGLPIPSTWIGEFHREFHWDPEDPTCTDLEVSPDAEYGYQCADTYKMRATVVED